MEELPKRRKAKGRRSRRQELPCREGDDYTVSDTCDVDEIIWQLDEREQLGVRESLTYARRWGRDD